METRHRVDKKRRWTCIQCKWATQIERERGEVRGNKAPRGEEAEEDLLSGRAGHTD